MKEKTFPNDSFILSIVLFLPLRLVVKLSLHFIKVLFGVVFLVVVIKYLADLIEFEMNFSDLNECILQGLIGCKY